MKLRLDASSDRGKVREHNEDMVIAGNILFRDDSCSIETEVGNGDAFFAGVADGMGGHQAGEVASSIAALSIARRVNSFDFSAPDCNPSALFPSWIREIHDTIVRDGNDHPERAGMGTTLVGLFILKRRFYLVNAGDSRLYLLRKGQLNRLTRDHSLRELSGFALIPSNILANSIGAGEDVFTDFEEILPSPVPGDVFLLCSDGLSDMLTDTEIASILSGEGDGAAQALVARANGNGGADNVSVLIVRLEVE